jgi:Domain of unknown function (DUF2760)
MEIGDILLVAGITVAALVLLRIVIIFALAGWDAGRVSLARRAGFRIFRDAAFAAKVQDLLEPKPPKPSGEAVRILALLQREGRLLDFLLEDVQAYTNDQIGAAVRDIHKSCQHALKEHVVLGPVIAKQEGDNVEVPAGFDPSAIRLTGNVTGDPPFRGTLRHHGWRVKELKLSPPPEGQDELVLQPAEVEL